MGHRIIYKKMYCLFLNNVRFVLKIILVLLYLKSGKFLSRIRLRKFTLAIVNFLYLSEIFSK